MEPELHMLACSPRALTLLASIIALFDGKQSSRYTVVSKQILETELGLVDFIVGKPFVDVRLSQAQCFDQDISANAAEMFAPASIGAYSECKVQPQVGGLSYCFGTERARESTGRRCLDGQCSQ